jgi:hypothetical protein
MSASAAGGGERKILVLPHGNAYADIMSERAEQTLCELGEVVRIAGPEHKVTAEEVAPPRGA